LRYNEKIVHPQYNKTDQKYRRCTSMNYLGIDYHKNYSYATMITEQGEIKKKEKLINRKETFREYLRGYSDVIAVVEASWAWPVAVELLEGLVAKVVLAHPYKVRVIAESRIKTDSIDSEALAYLLRADLIPQAYMRSKEELKRQKVLRARSYMVKMRTQVKNRIHALMGTQKEEIREAAGGYSDLFGKRGLEWLRGLELEEPDVEILGELIEIYETLCGKIGKFDKDVKRMVEEDPDCGLLKSIPGIGDFFAAVIKGEIGDIGRFPSVSKLCSYAGLVPSTHASGGKVWHGKLTKQGSKWLRWATVEAVTPAICSNGEMRSYYERLRYKKGPKAARVATARRLLAIVYRVLRDKDTFKVYKKDIGKKAGLPSQFTSAA
jgi:transposase